jgi:predicted DCC family thiol-disulfide oxidoreductase YuxK
MYQVIYDGNCNLCVNLVRILEQIDRGDRFQYAPMQDQEILAFYGITLQDCEMGMLLISQDKPEQRWQGSDAAEEIGQLLPAAAPIVAAYRALPGAKWVGDRFYEQIRDNRYTLFGQRAQTYQSSYPAIPDSASNNAPADLICQDGNCMPFGNDR